jgi:hypothetical protein
MLREALLLLRSWLKWPLPPWSGMKRPRFYERAPPLLSHSIRFLL